MQVVKDERAVRRSVIAAGIRIGVEEEIRGKEEKSAKRIVEVHRVVIDHDFALTASQPVDRHQRTKYIAVIGTDIQPVGFAEASPR